VAGPGPGRRSRNFAASEFHFPFTYVLAIGAPLRIESLANITGYTQKARTEVVTDKVVLPVNGTFLPFDIP